MALNHKLQTFVDVYDGDANKAADIAGISQQYGRRLVMSTLAAGSTPKSKEVQLAIQSRNDNATRIATDATVVVGKVASRLDRQRFWTKMMTDEDEINSDRLRASELLGKSEADFIDVVKSEHTMRLQLGAPRAATEARTLPEGAIDALPTGKDTEEDTDNG